MKDRTNVLIVGAGPCGLAAACELLRRGVAVRLLEAAPDRARGSRAILLWPLALDVLRDLGLYEQARQLGLPVRALAYHLADGTDLRSEIGGPNAALLLPQEQTNLLLQTAFEELGGRVEWSTHVTDVTADGDPVTVKVQGPEGAELIEADWLIGADGVGSTVRERLGIKFSGANIEATYLAAEGHIEGSFERGVVHYFLRSSGPMVFAPLAGGIVRLGGPIAPGTPVNAESVQRMLDERGSGGLRAADIQMITTFTSQERIAASLRSGRCFLVGDAAHTHSPVGGQGLNLGLQDVHNLVWKLAGVIDGLLDPAVLDTYQPERLHAARTTVADTRRYTKVFMLGPKAARVRNAVWRVLEGTGTIRRRLVPLLAGWKMQYPQPLAGATPEPPSRPATWPAAWPPAWGTRALPQAGARTPAWVPAPPVGTDPADGFLRLLTLGSAGGALARAARELSAGSPRLVAYQHADRGPSGFLLLRPDGHVAASGRTVADLDRARRLLAALAASA